MSLRAWLSPSPFSEQYITSDSLAYLPLEAMHEAVVAARASANGVAKPAEAAAHHAHAHENGHGRSLPMIQDSTAPLDRFCHACWTGEYPVEFSPPPKARQMRLLDI